MQFLVGLKVFQQSNWIVFFKQKKKILFFTECLICGDSSFKNFSISSNSHNELKCEKNPFSQDNAYTVWGNRATTQIVFGWLRDYIPQRIKSMIFDIFFFTPGPLRRPSTQKFFKNTLNLSCQNGVFSMF